MKVLLVDDENLVRQGLAGLMHAVRPDIQILHASTAEEMEKHLDKDGPFDLLFLDINLKGYGDRQGLQLLSQLKEDGLLTPIIMLSGQEDRDTVMDSINRGAYGFLPKGAGNTEMLGQAINTVLSGGVYLPSTIHGKGGKEPPELGAVNEVKEVNAQDLKLAPRIYETAYYVSQGLRGKAVADVLNVSESVAAEYSGKVYQQIAKIWGERVTGRIDLITKLNKKGLKLRPPESLSKTS